jgi:uncharacterized damage-inducible protein DinB
LHKIISSLIILGLSVLTITFIAAQENKSVESPKPVQSPSQELLLGWTSVGNKLIAMAEDFPEEKYNFKAQKDERTFGGNLLHVAMGYYFTINAIKGTPIEYDSDDSLQKKYPTKANIVNFLKQAVADGAKSIEEQGENGLTREFKYWGNRMVHVSFGLMGAIEHAGEHYGQLVVYYRLNGLIPPQSRPRK